MKNKKILFTIFFLVVIIQLFVPAKMIYDNEDVLSTGKEFKFRTAPIDPIDPFRGKYIFLQYKENIIEIENEKNWKIGETVFLILENDKNGFAKIKSVSMKFIQNNNNFVKAKIVSIFSNKLTINYPFDRFYMEETKAGKAETSYNKSLADTNKITYALVAIKNGNAVLKNIFIDDIPIKEFVNK
ncbi:MAG: GDYXXLXY domain-containing protein [Melioribacteraceae bacterium]